MEVINMIVIDGVLCQKSGVYYTFTVPGWEECTVYGLKAARRVIRGRLDPAVRRTLQIDEREDIDEQKQ